MWPKTVVCGPWKQQLRRLENCLIKWLWKGKTPCVLHLNSDDTLRFLFWRWQWQPVRTLFCVIVSGRKLVFSFICMPPSFSQTFHTCTSLFNNWKLVKASCWDKERHFVILLLFLSYYSGSFLQGSEAATEKIRQNQKVFGVNTQEFVVFFKEGKIYCLFGDCCVLCI